VPWLRRARHSRAAVLPEQGRGSVLDGIWGPLPGDRVAQGREATWPTGLLHRLGERQGAYFGEGRSRPFVDSSAIAESYQ
jgi:hypothetical protein